MTYGPLRWDTPHELIRLLRWLDSQHIIDLSGHRLPASPSNADIAASLSQMTVDDPEVLKEFCFGAFLYWFYTKKFVERLRRRATFHFVELSPSQTLFLLHVPASGAIGLYGENGFVDSRNLLPQTKIPGGGRCNICARMLTLRLSCTRLLLGHRGADPEQFFPPTRTRKDCKHCAREMKKWLAQGIAADVRYASLLGGYGAVLNLRPEVFRPAYGAEEPWKLAEEVLHASLGVYLFTQGDFESLASGVFIHQPVVANEVDIILCNFQTGRQLVVETTMEFAISESHLRAKLVNAASLAQSGATSCHYVYMTMAKLTSTKGDHAKDYINAAKSAGKTVGFEIVALPDEYYRHQKEKNRPLEEQVFRDIFDYYLQRLQRHM